MEIDFAWISAHWKDLFIAALLGRNFLNNLLANCPFLKANKVLELVQGIFNAAIQTVTQQKIETGIPVSEDTTSPN